MEKEIKTTERQIGQFREQLSRIIRQVDMIDKGKTHTKDGWRRLDIIVECAKNIDSQCKVMGLNLQSDSKRAQKIDWDLVTGWKSTRNNK